MDMPVRPPTISMSIILFGLFRSTWRWMFVAAASITSFVCVVVNRFSTVTLKVSFSFIFGVSSVTVCLISFRSVRTTFSMGMTLRV